MNDKRFFINLIKGTAIFLMLWGHCIQYCVSGSNVDFFENITFKIIYSFHMPLFMLVSGYLFFSSFKKRNMRELLAHRAQGMLQPIVLGNVFIFLVTTVLFAFLKGKYTILFNGGWMSSLSSLWFLWSVLSASIVMTVVCKRIKKTYLQILLLVIFSVVVTIFPNAEMNLYMYPYFVIGFYFAKYENKIPYCVKKLKYVSLVAFPIMAYFYEKKHYIYTTGLYSSDYTLKECLFIDIYRWIIGLVGSVFAVTILHFIYAKIILRFNRPIISCGVANLGEKSLQIYVLSVPFLSVYLMVGFPYFLRLLNIENIFVKNEPIYSLVFTFLLSVIYAIVLYLIQIILEKIKLSRLIFGR